MQNFTSPAMWRVSVCSVTVTPLASMVQISIKFMSTKSYLRAFNANRIQLSGLYTAHLKVGLVTLLDKLGQSKSIGESVSTCGCTYAHSRVISIDQSPLTSGYSINSRDSAKKSRVTFLVIQRRYLGKSASSKLGQFSQQRNIFKTGNECPRRAQT